MILVMAISAAGYITVRTFGAPVRPPNRRSRIWLHLKHRDYRRNGCARCKGAGSSRGGSCGRGTVNHCYDRSDGTGSIAATSMTTLRTLSIPLICAGSAAVVYGIVFAIRALRQKTEGEAQSGRAFSLSTALVFALTLSSILVASAALGEWFCETGIIVVATLAGFVDTHSAAISVASLVASGKMSAADAVSQFWRGFRLTRSARCFSLA